MGIRLAEAGFGDFTILEAASGVGGTWWHNRYPGAACDVPSDLYSFSFELKTDWSRPYAPQSEIQAYLHHCADRYGVTPHVRTNSPVEALHWDDECECWRVILSSGEQLRADVVVSALGMFNEPKWPEIDGLDRFGGTLVHSARWPARLDLAGADVAVIGSAASAVQLIPPVAARANSLVVYQRTANWVLAKDDEPFSPDQLAEFRANPMLVRQRRWKTWHALERFTDFNNAALREQFEELGRENLAVIADPELRERLTPREPFGCKRPLFSNEYYPAFNRPNVTLVDGGIAQVTPDGVVDGTGTARRADVIIAATGFHTTRFLSAITVTGRKGVPLDSAWGDGAQAYLGMAVPRFPNLFQLYGPNTNQGSILFMLECQSSYIARQLRRMGDEGLATIEVRRDHANNYNAALQDDLESVAVWQIDCHHYYRAPSGRIVTQYPYPMSTYRARTSQPDHDAYDVTAGLVASER